MGQFSSAGLAHNQPGDYKMPLKKRKIVHKDTISLIIVIIIGAIILFITNLFIFGIL
jgi:hypothetical protein